ncbi:hypothetical protein GXW83_11670 [Streptacidiphilus sp. PB12-B1b]|uniref:hypothetical protein n=1 Tax=Streptacidiphilus sp. PB12-B1b TaxID=2705012 RepID=UPI0015F7E6FA|nr:hypothetical protein [Streptacidiphilus sp. PB12-B1b]QMU76304.1 hypothetical protein GXW83_11670 [Streptacidiphilus sp. PB12-B1b]
MADGTTGARRAYRLAGRWAGRLTVTLALALVGGLIGGAGGLWADDAGTPPAHARSRGGDAVWLGHAWVDGRKDEADVLALAARLRGTGVHDLFVHTGPLADDGTLDPALYPRAAWLVRALHRAAPGIRVQSWLGDTVDSEGPGLDPDRVDLTGAVGQVLDAGFDGVQLDLEPVHSGDPGFLRLLARVHALTGARGRVLSVSVPQIDPLPGLHAVAGLLTGHPKWWSSGYLAQVAARVDQVAVMAYDTGMPLPSLDSGYVEQQTALALDAVPPSVDLLIGLPAYHADALGHVASAETVAAAIRGVRLADRGRAGFGVALYADFTATAQDWAAYRADWVR